MSNELQFLTKEEEQKLIKAIEAAEKNTSGEIRIHIEATTEKPPLERAKEVFYFLGMQQTQLKNGVLIYVAVNDKKFAILGDQGINEKVPNNFWEEEKNAAIAHFSRGEYCEGLSFIVKEVGMKLKDFFPYQSNDTNELSNEISKG